jgi:hypothetical protein
MRTPVGNGNVLVVLNRMSTSWRPIVPLPRRQTGRSTEERVVLVVLVVLVGLLLLLARAEFPGAVAPVLGSDLTLVGVPRSALGILSHKCKDCRRLRRCAGRRRTLVDRSSCQFGSLKFH